jgi:hypothetical protein
LAALVRLVYPLAIVAVETLELRVQNWTMADVPDVLLSVMEGAAMVSELGKAAPVAADPPIGDEVLLPEKTAPVIRWLDVQVPDV